MKKSVRLSEEMQKHAVVISPFDDINYSVAINAMADQLSLFISDNTPELSDSEWNVFYSIYNGYMPSRNAKEEARMLWWHVSEGYQYDETVREFLGDEDSAEKFIDRVRDWPISVQLSVIYTAQEFWTKHID